MGVQRKTIIIMKKIFLILFAVSCGIMTMSAQSNNATQGQILKEKKLEKSDAQKAENESKVDPAEVKDGKVGEAKSKGKSNKDKAKQKAKNRGKHKAKGHEKHDKDEVKDKMKDHDVKDKKKEKKEKKEKKNKEDKDQE